VHDAARVERGERRSDLARETERTPPAAVSDKRLIRELAAPVADEEPAPQSEPMPSGSMSRRRGRSPLWVLIPITVLVAGAVVYLRPDLMGRGGGAPPTTAATAAAAPPEPPSASAPALPPSASVTAPASQKAPVPTVTEVGGLDAKAWKQKVLQAQMTKNYAGAVQGLLALAELDPKALDAVDVKAAAVDIATTAGHDPKQLTQLLETMVSRFGASGIDVLYTLFTMRGGSTAATRAAEILKRPEVRAAATPALRIALELREASCADKVPLMDRVKKDGDERSLAILISVRSEECQMTGCCLRDKEPVEAAVKELLDRQKKAP